jgi:hypothetical protein
MNYRQIIRYARGVMQDHGIIIPERSELIHYIRVILFFAEMEKKKLTGRQVSYRLIEIARKEYNAAAARCAGKRVGVGQFSGGDSINFLAAEDVL